MIRVSFVLFMLVVLCKVSMNSELVSTMPLFLMEMEG